LKSDRDICIVQADKGNVTVILDAKDYDKKILDILEDEDTYSKVDADPTLKIEKALSAKLKTYFYPINEDNKSRYKFLLSTNGSPPMLYGLPKIHKPPTYPCRPIVDFNPSPLKNLSSFLNTHLSPLTGKLDSHLKNSSCLKEQISTMKLDADEDLVSFDVISLYSSIPYDLAIVVCTEYITKVPDFEKSSNMKINHFLDLLDFCLRNTYFIYKDYFYLQIKGLPMGAAISVTIANMVMEYLEIKVFSADPSLDVKFLKRYIDDILCACRRELITRLLESLNSFHKDIQFTVEHQIDDSIPYLDTMISKEVDGSLLFTVYRKPTHSSRYLEYFSSNPIAHKKSVAASLFHRALSICSNDRLYAIERNIIFLDLQKNGYPKDFITRTEKDVIKKRLDNSRNTSRQSEISFNQDLKTRRVCLPYISSWSEAVTRILKSYDLELTHRPINKLRYIWGNQKTHLPIHKHMNAIYQIPCGDCDLVYIGESNNANRRMKEHEADYRLNRPENTALALHSHSCNHTPNLKAHCILANDGYYLTRKLSESFFIQNNNKALNKHPGSLPPLYLTSELFKHFQ
jgi:hypothetical protein